jgi:hypothetical protein
MACLQVGGAECSHALHTSRAVFTPPPAYRLHDIEVNTSITTVRHALTNNSDRPRARARSAEAARRSRTLDVVARA